MSKRTREDIVRECVRAAEACFNYYSDHLLLQSVRIQITECLNRVLPDPISVQDWQKYSDDYEKRLAAEA